jgi:hypothetical protein
MPSDIVEKVKASEWMADGGEQRTTYWVTLVNETGQREVPCYDPRGKDLKEDAPLPEGWEVKTSKAGKPYLAAPKVSGGGGWTGGSGRSAGASAAWRNTEAGAKWEDERVDRRRALEQAVAWWAAVQAGTLDENLRIADAFYAWLRESVSGPLGAEPPLPAPVTARSQAAAGIVGGADTPSDEGGGQPNSPPPQVTPPPRPPKPTPEDLNRATEVIKRTAKRTANQPPAGWDQ